MTPFPLKPPSALLHFNMVQARSGYNIVFSLTMLRPHLNQS